MNPPNGLGISGGAPIDRYDCRDASDLQKSDDLVGAKRRPLHARVGRRSCFMALESDVILILTWKHAVWFVSYYDRAIALLYVAACADSREPMLRCARMPLHRPHGLRGGMYRV